MAPKRDDKDDLVTVGVCNENRATTRYWLGGCGVLALAVCLLIADAAWAGYRAQINLDLYIAEQKSFKVLMLDKAEAVGEKVDGIGARVDNIGTTVTVIGSEVASIAARVQSFDERFDVIETKFQTTWDHDSDNRKADKLILELLQKLNDSTE